MTRRAALSVFDVRAALSLASRWSNKIPNCTRMGQTRRTSSGNAFVLKPKYSDFKKVSASRPGFDPTLPIVTTQSPDPTWRYGQGTVHSGRSTSEVTSERRWTPEKPASEHQFVEIDPYAGGRKMMQNYQLLISAVPRPISFISTVGTDGSKNLSPFSYFQVVDHDPPIFVVGFSARATRPKDTRRNLTETGQCVISVMSEHMIEAANASSMDVPYGTSEWDVSGFVPGASTTVKPERIQDAIFSVEGRLLEIKDLDYHGHHAARGEPAGALAIIEATRFWVREDALNAEQSEIDLSVLRPLIQLGGISYGRVRETFELPRYKVEDELKDKVKGLAKVLKVVE